ncbi:MAG: MotA/TolQ/ExbB proton channel family protein [Planctomycetota bacterium]
MLASGLLDQAVTVFRAGGWVMYPLLMLSVIGVALSLERAMFFARADGRSARRAAVSMSRMLASGQMREARAVAQQSAGVYGDFVISALRSGGAAAVAAAFEGVRPSVERFTPTLSAIITAAPMLGILGTVVGIIDSFRLLGDAGPITDPAAVASGIATALYTTAFGLTVALVVLFPYVAIRSRAGRCAARLDALAVAIESQISEPDAPVGEAQAERSSAASSS